MKIKNYKEFLNESFDEEELYKEIEKDRKTKMYSDIDDGTIEFDHKDVAKGISISKLKGIIKLKRMVSSKTKK